jgi:hypothetical protein
MVDQGSGLALALNVRWRLGAVFFDRLAKADAIPKWVDDRHLHHAPFHLLERWAIMPIPTLIEFSMECGDARHVDIRDRARRTVAVVLAKMNDQGVTRDLHIGGGIRLGAILPIDLASQKID